MNVQLSQLEQDAIFFVCDVALKAAGNNALQAVVMVHQALSRGQQEQAVQRDAQAVDAN